MKPTHRCVYFTITLK